MPRWRNLHLLRYARGAGAALRGIDDAQLALGVLEARKERKTAMARRWLIVAQRAVNRATASLGRVPAAPRTAPTRDTYDPLVHCTLPTTASGGATHCDALIFTSRRRQHLRDEHHVDVDEAHLHVYFVAREQPANRAPRRAERRRKS